MTWILFFAGCVFVTIASLMAYAWFLTRGEPSPPTPYEIPQEVWDSAQADRRAREREATAVQGVI